MHTLEDINKACRSAVLDIKSASIDELESNEHILQGFRDFIPHGEGRLENRVSGCWLAHKDGHSFTVFAGSDELMIDYNQGHRYTVPECALFAIDRPIEDFLSAVMNSYVAICKLLADETAESK